MQERQAEEGIRNDPMGLFWLLFLSVRVAVLVVDTSDMLIVERWIWKVSDTEGRHKDAGGTR